MYLTEIQCSDTEKYDNRMIYIDAVRYPSQKIQNRSFQIQNPVMYTDLTYYQKQGNNTNNLIVDHGCNMILVN